MLDSPIKQILYIILLNTRSTTAQFISKIESSAFSMRKTVRSTTQKYCSKILEDLVSPEGIRSQRRQLQGDSGHLIPAKGEERK